MKYTLYIFLLFIEICYPSFCSTTTYDRIPNAPENFVYLKKVSPSIIESVRYASEDNFTGKSLPGYHASKIILTRPAANALHKVQDEMMKNGYSLVVYDGYRPQPAVNEFLRWSKDLSNTITQQWYYPTLEKSELFEKGYIAKKSGHSRGSTVDLSIIPLGDILHPIETSTRILTNGDIIPFLDDGTVDMGSSFDFFHEVSHHNTSLIDDPKPTFMRTFLRRVMEKHGFQAYEEEWWHYTLKEEPYPNIYFDFIVK